MPLLLVTMFLASFFCTSKDPLLLPPQWHGCRRGGPYDPLRLDNCLRNVSRRPGALKDPSERKRGTKEPSIIDNWTGLESFSPLMKP